MGLGKVAILCLLGLALTVVAQIDEEAHDLMDDMDFLDEDVDSKCVTVTDNCVVTNKCGQQNIVLNCDDYEGKGRYRLHFRLDHAVHGYQIPGCASCELLGKAEDTPPIDTASRSASTSYSARSGSTGISNTGGCANLHGSCWDLNRASCQGSVVSGLCNGGSNIKCCVPPSAEQGSGCVNVKGQCVDTRYSSCSGQYRSGLCPGPSQYKCCVPSSGSGAPTAGPRSRPAPRVTCRRGEMGKLVPIPTDLVRAQLGLTYPRHSVMLSKLGQPCALQKDCAGITNRNLSRKLRSARVGHIKVYGMGPAVDSLVRIFTRIQKDLPDVWASVKSSGMVCCRAIRGSTKSYSNHSWGMAIDFNINGVLDPRGDAKTQCALLAMWPYFNEEGWYWAGGYRGRSEDAMHFEVSEQLVLQWLAEGKL